MAATYCGNCGAPAKGAFCGVCGASTGLPPAAPDATVDDVAGGAGATASGTLAAGATAAAAYQPPPVMPPTNATTPIPQSAYSDSPYAGEWAGGPPPPAYAPIPATWHTPPVSGPPGAPEPPEQPERSTAVWVLAGLLAAVLVLGAGFFVAKATFLKGADTAAPTSPTAPATPGVIVSETIPSTPSETIPSESTPPPTPTSTPVPTVAPPPPPPVTPVTPPPTPSARAVAYAKLEKYWAEDAKRPVVRGQWVAMLASKREGIVDPTQQPEPFTVPQILAEHERLRNNPVFGSYVRMVHLGDWGTTQPESPPMWVTVADLNASTKANAQRWCEAHFTERGTALANICTPRQMRLKATS